MSQSDQTASQALYAFCRALPGVTEDVKWDNDLVFSVHGKMFAVFALPEGRKCSFKVEPETFSILVQQEGIEPAPYLARHGWVLLADLDVMPRDVLRDFLQASHALVASKLPKKVRERLGLLER